MSTIRRGLATVLSVLALAACAPVDGTVEQPVATPSPSEPVAVPTVAPATAPPTAATGGVGNIDGVLRIGTILPLTGALSFLAPPQVAAVRLAIDDINAAGGVLGGPIVLLEGDSATDAATARVAAGELISQGADAIVGAAASSVTRGILQTVSDGPAVQCSASATAVDLIGRPDATRFVRPVPPDEAVGRAIATVLAADEVLAAHIVVGAAAGGMAAELTDAFTELGGTVTARSDLAETSTGAAVDAVQAALRSPATAASSSPSSGPSTSPERPGRVVVLGYTDVDEVVAALLDAGVDPAVLVLSDAAFTPRLAERLERDVDAITVVGVGGDEGFSQRLDAVLDDSDDAGNLLYGAQAYDCVVLIALAAAAAGTDATLDVRAQLPEVSSGGTVCRTYEACIALLADGEDIDYDGVAGPVDLDPSGEATVGRYAIASFRDGRPAVTGSVDVPLGSSG